MALPGVALAVTAGITKARTVRFLNSETRPVTPGSLACWHYLITVTVLQLSLSRYLPLLKMA